tara:strand:+ start:2187 stop:2768 length:582 start_codon:yes stop_codon:yes gene_type:complete
MAERESNIEYPQLSFKEIFISKMIKIYHFFKFYIMKLYIRILMPFNLKLKEIPLHLIYSAVRFDLGDKGYNFDKLYRSLLKTNGLDLKNHAAPMVFPLSWTGDCDSDKKALELKFKYRVQNGNHRIATLKFMNLSRRLGVYEPYVMVKVLVANAAFLEKLDTYGFISHMDAINRQVYVYENGIKNLNKNRNIL